MSGRTTIADIAKKVGVSKTTVSHALSGKRPISSDVRARILKAVESLDYNPSPLAKAMAGQRMMLVALLVDGLAKPSTGILLEFFQRAFSAHGYNMSVFVCNEEKNARRLIKYLSGGVVDGILNLLPFISVDKAACLCIPTPVLSYLRPHPDSPLYLDIAAGMREALDHLWTLGHRRIGFIGGSQIRSVEMDKDPQQDAYAVFMKSRGAWDPELESISSLGEFSDGVNCAGKFYGKGATAIVAANDQSACGVLSWASNNGVRTPEDLSVISYNDTPLAMMASPSLTAVQFPYQEIADATANALVDRIHGSDFVHHRVLFPKLIIRNSTAISKC